MAPCADGIEHVIPRVCAECPWMRWPVLESTTCILSRQKHAVLLTQGEHAFKEHGTLACRFL
jgi:hypothetical protein